MPDRHDERPEPPDLEGLVEAVQLRMAARRTIASRRQELRDLERKLRTPKPLES